METVMTMKNALDFGTGLLCKAGIREAALDAWLLLEYITGVDKAHYYLEPERALSKEEKERYEEALKKREGRIPLQHITGEQYFMGLPFRVNPHVLIPRQDTEILVEEALAELRPGMRVLDLCTGSGCIIISLERLAKEEQKKGVCFEASDLSPEALETARENGARLCSSAEFFEGDLFAPLSGSYDMILSNPPYIRRAEIEGLQKEVRRYDPFMALDGGEDGLYFYRRIIREAKKYLSGSGRLLFEIGCGQGEAVSGILEAEGYEGIRVKKDLAGLDRVVAAMYNRA